MTSIRCMASCMAVCLRLLRCQCVQCGTVCQIRDGQSRVWYWQAAVAQMAFVKPFAAGFLSYSSKLEDDTNGVAPVVKRQLQAASISSSGASVSSFASFHDAFFASNELRVFFRFVSFLSTAAATHTLLEAYCSLKPQLGGLQPVRKFFVMKVLIALLLMQDIIIDSWLSMQQQDKMETLGEYGVLELFVRQAHAVRGLLAYFDSTLFILHFMPARCGYTPGVDEVLLTSSC